MLITSLILMILLLYFAVREAIVGTGGWRFVLLGLALAWVAFVLRRMWTRQLRARREGEHETGG